LKLEREDLMSEKIADGAIMEARDMVKSTIRGCVTEDDFVSNQTEGAVQKMGAGRELIVRMRQKSFSFSDQVDNT
jgi:hypothetical protein